MKNSFSFDRFWNLSKLYDASTRRTSIVVLLCMAGVIMLPYIINVLSYIYKGYFSAETCAQSSFIVIAIVWMASISASFKPYFSRSEASAALMLPATNREKFSYIFIRTFIVNYVVLVGLAFVIYAIWSLAVTGTMHMELWLDFTLKEGVYTLLVTGFIHAFYLLGASIFRRNSFILTSLCGLGLLMVFGFCIGIIINSWVDKAGNIDSNIDLLETINLWGRRVLPIVLGASTLFMWWLSWRRFTKIQITK